MSDANTLLAVLGDVERAVSVLREQPARREVGEQVRSGGGYGSRLPLAVEVLDALVEVPRALQTWTRVVHYRLDRPDLDSCGPVDGSTDASCAYLRAQVAWLSTVPLGDRFHEDLVAMRAVLTNLPGSPLWREVVRRTECLLCRGTVETRVTPAGTRVDVASKCRDCGRVYSDLALAEAMAAQAQRVDWLPADTVVSTLAAHGLAVTEDAIHKWADRRFIDRRRFNGRRHYLPEQVARRARRDDQTEAS